MRRQLLLSVITAATVACVSKPQPPPAASPVAANGKVYLVNEGGETFVLDWGLATNFERTSTFFSPNEPTMRPHSASGGSSSGQRGGTYGYSSPEQILFCKS